MSLINNLKINSTFNNITLQKTNESRRIGQISSSRYPLKDEFEVAYFKAQRDFFNNEISTHVHKSPQDVCNLYKKQINNKM